MRTRDKLAAELRKVAAMASPENAAKYEAFAKRAETGEFDDYADTYVCPITQLYNELTAAGFTKFAGRVADGEFDATKEESDEWAASPSGQETLARLSPEMRKAMLGDEPSQSIGDKPIEPKFREQMNQLARAIDEFFNGKGPRKVGFAMMVFDFGDGPGRCNYISNAQRDDIVILLKEQLKRFEGQPDIEGHA